MNAKFHPAIKAVRSDDLETFKALVAKDPSLATSGSTQSHPTLLQCVVLDGNSQPNNVEMARVLIEAGAELDGPRLALWSCREVVVAGSTGDYQQRVRVRVHARPHRRRATAVGEGR